MQFKVRWKSCSGALLFCIVAAIGVTAQTYTVIANLTGGNAYPQSSLIQGVNGNLYGTSTWGGVHGYGLVFKLSPSPSGWVYTDLYEFTGGNDGCYPWDGLALDSSGNVYGTASNCGQYGGNEQGGTLWEITP